jgi:4-diphosphocytidyl-2-C-methyl-D-erythritol kinase
VSARLELRAHAKVNLALSVGPPEPPTSAHPGFHPICSWMHAVDLADELTLERLPGRTPSSFQLGWAGETDGADDRPVEWPTAKDLAVRAHAALEDLAGRALPVDLTLRKHIPAGGGLGGGSSDAAMTLLGLDRLFDLRLTEAELHALAATLGSDVPFFLDAESFAAGMPPRPAIVSGFGGGIERLPRRVAHLILLFPPFGCPTGPVYRAYDEHPAALDEASVCALASADRIDSASLFNDLADPAGRVEPRLAELRDRLSIALGDVPHVSGSGSTLFLLAADRDEAHALAHAAIAAAADPPDVRTAARAAGSRLLSSASMGLSDALLGLSPTPGLRAAVTMLV